MHIAVRKCIIMSKKRKVISLKKISSKLLPKMEGWGKFLPWSPL
jgi:hypothetical protein